MPYVYDYPRPMVTVDIFLLRFTGDALETLLIQRKHPPFEGMWALPGGFIEMEEKPLDSAHRELAEETGLGHIPLFPLGFAGDPGRDPRGRTITLIYGGILSPPFPQTTAGDDARRAEWFSLTQLPSLAFDHREIIENSLDEIRNRALWNAYALLFLPERFTRSDLEKLSLHLFETKEPGEMMLRFARKRKWVEETGEGGFCRLTAEVTILSSTFRENLPAWM